MNKQSRKNNKSKIVKRTKKLFIPKKYNRSSIFTVKTNNNTQIYSKVPVANKIQFRLNKIFKKNFTAFNIALTLQEKKKLIRQIIGSYAIRQLSKTAQFYYIKPFNDLIYNKIYTKNIEDMNTNVENVINKIQDLNNKVFIHGGTIRDIFINKEPTDIDLVFDCTVQSLEKLCKNENWPCSIIDIKNQYINFGENKGISLEGENLKSKFLIPMYYHETTINDFAYDCQTNILIDISGNGLEDIVYRKIRLSPLPENWNKWASTDYMGKRPLRYFKLIQKGFKPYNDGSLEFVVNYIKDNFDKIYEKHIKSSYPIAKIKHFLIVNITMGNIDAETGVYSYGANEDKLIPYLKVLKRYLGKEYFYRIMSHFDENDLLLFKNKDIISNISKIIKHNKISSIRKNKK